MVSRTYGTVRSHRPVDLADVVLARDVDPGVADVRAGSRQQAEVVAVQEPSRRRTMVSSSRRSAASGASLCSGMVARVGAPITEATAPMLSSGAANCTGAPLGGG